MDMEKLAELVKAATPGPWIDDNNEGYGANRIWAKCSPSGNGTPGPAITSAIGDSAEAEANAALIAMAPDLAAEVIRLTDEVQSRIAFGAELIDDNARLTAINAELVAANARLVARDAEAQRLLDTWKTIADHCSISDGVCCCGDEIRNHADPMSCGHVPCDHGERAASETYSQTLSYLAGGK